MLHCMEEIARELAKILVQIAPKEEGEDPEDYKARLDHLRKQQRDLESELMMASRVSLSEDPVLTKLAELAVQKRDIVEQIRLIVAYSREFIRPEPYRLRALAEAADMSISGVRTAYTPEDVGTIASRIDRKNTKGSVFPAQPKPPSAIPQPPTSPGEQWWKLPEQNSLRGESNLPESPP